MTAGFRSYQDLDVWKKGLAIATFRYQATANRRGEEGKQ
jgi:hypothetical protein